MTKVLDRKYAKQKSKMSSNKSRIMDELVMARCTHECPEMTFKHVLEKELNPTVNVFQIILVSSSI
jgi:hypothetical protein